MLSVIHGFLAITDIYAPNVPQETPTKLFGMNLRDVLLLVGAALVLASILFLWAYAARRSRRAIATANPRAIIRKERHEPDADGRVKFRKKRRRREHPGNLPRNPSLAETGGLPPMRKESTEPTQ